MRFVCRFCKLPFDVKPENATWEVLMIQTSQCPIMVKGRSHSLFGELPPDMKTFARVLKDGGE